MESAATTFGLMTYERCVDRFPIVPLDDGLAESDWAGFPVPAGRLGDPIQIVGDDNYLTDAAYIRCIAERSTNLVLIKLNQIGTVTETIADVEPPRHGVRLGFVVSRRSGQIEDPFSADFAVTMGGGQIKTGSLCCSERIVNYNRLLETEWEPESATICINPFERHPA